MGKSPIRRWKMSLPNAQPNYHFSHVTTAGEHTVGRQSDFNDEEDKDGHRRIIPEVIFLRQNTALKVDDCHFRW